MACTAAPLCGLLRAWLRQQRTKGQEISEVEQSMPTPLNGNEHCLRDWLPFAKQAIALNSSQILTLNDSGAL